MKSFYCGVFAVVLAAAAACSTRSPVGAPRADAPRASAPVAIPRLVVLLVIDGLPQRQLLDVRPQLAPDGLRRFLERGAWFSEAHHGHAHTVTAPGHAAMVTGTHPYRHGIIGNEWRHPGTLEVENCVGDPAHSYIGHKGARLGTSPRHLKAETVGDALRTLHAASKVIAISFKDRGAIIPAGRKGAAYVYMSQTGEFASTTFYMREHPAWVKEFNARKPANAFFHQAWQPLLPDAAYARSLPDSQKWYARGGKLPKKLGEGQQKPGPAFYAEVAATHFGDRLALDFARAAIAGEALGRDASPDLLVVSLSAHDAVNHSYSAESRLSHDHLLQLDRLLEAFLRDLDASVGRGEYVAVVTADHGFMPAPEHSVAQGRGGGRLNGTHAVARINAKLNERFTPGPYVIGGSASGLVFNKAIAARNKVDLKAVVEETRRLLLEEPAFAEAYTRTELEAGSRTGAPFFEPVRKTWHREVSGDVQFVLKPHWMLASWNTGTTHGSPHAYDTHVPLLFHGPGFVRAGRHDSAVQTIDIAATLAALMGVPAPASSEGKVLPVLARR